jgi:hypothetical protein
MVRTKKRSRKSNADGPSRTEELVNWISSVRRKKSKCRRNRRRNLRIEAMLTHALLKAEDQLRIEQTSIASKRQQLRKKLLKKINYSNYELGNGGDMENSGLSQQCNPWNEPLCDELSSLANFMSQLAEVKVPLQR